ncbi:MAG: hypothetical protein QOJ38_965 [Solirubrobacterales bacterium]|jgi:hypothetical protein|nr:hypothetical protein [Solirubrobacterales bacterium]
MKARFRTALVLLVAIAIAGCGGGGGHKQTPIVPGGNAEPGSPEFGENVARVPGISTTDVAAAAILAAYPPGQASPTGWILYPGDDWRRGALGAQFVGKPIGGALLPTGKDFLPPAAADLITRYSPGGFPRGQGLQTLILGSGGEEVVAALQRQNIKLSQLSAPSPAKLAADLVPYRGGWAQRYSNNIVIVSQTADEYGLPAAAWSAFSGDTLTFVDRNSVPADTKALLVQRQKLRIDKPAIYLIGPKSVISTSVESELGKYGTVKRIAGIDAADTAVHLAEYKDSKTGFGWGLKKGAANVSFVNRQNLGDASGAINLAGSGPRAAMLLIDNSASLPGTVRSYLARLKNPKGNQGFVMGDPRSISSPLFAQIDALLAPQK